MEDIKTANDKPLANFENMNLKSHRVAEENKELLKTTKEVLKAMSEIRTYIKEHE